MITKQIVTEALNKIEDTEGRLTPGKIVKAAQPKGHPLHDHFQWDDKKAGYAFRLIQAQKLMTIRMKVVEENRSYSVPMYVHDPDLASHEQGYRNIMHVRKEPETAHAVLAAEMAQIAGHLRRARELAMVLGMSDAIVEIEGQVSEFIGALESQSPEQAAA